MTVAEYMAIEKEIQEQYLDPFYERRGLEITDRRGTKEYDLKVAMEGCLYAVEEKIRLNDDWDDLLVELMQDIRVPCSLGWLYTCKSDVLVYAKCPKVNGSHKLSRLYSIPFRSFQTWYGKNCQNFKQFKVSGEGWGITLNHVIPFEAIPEFLWTEYRNDPTDSKREASANMRRIDIDK